MFALRSILRYAKYSHIKSLSTSKMIYKMTSLKQQVKSVKIQKQAPKTEIVSLLSDQLQQLSNLNHYTTSVNYLQKNQIAKSYNHLEFALTQAKAKYSQSINLHMFLLNRMSILQKILGQSQKFIESIQQIFFMCLSLKGQKSLQTLKYLHNYMIALMTSNPVKLVSLVQFLHQSNLKTLIKKSDYLLALSQYFSGKKQESLKHIEQNTQATVPKYSRINNLSWFKLLDYTNQTLQIVQPDKQEQIQKILKDLIYALIQAEKVGELKTESKQIQKNLIMTDLLTQYVQKSTNVVLLKIKSDTILLNSQSHIITMNIAFAFYLLKKNQEATLFMKIAIQSSIHLQEPYRLGLGLTVLSKVNHRLKLMWEPTLINILINKNVYTPAVLKECLLTYSRFLFIEKRFYQSEAYANQAQNITQTNLYVQGLVLPDFDFSF